MSITPQMGQQPGIFGQGQQIPQWQAGAVGNPQMALQGALQCCPPEVVSAIVQTCPPQVLPYVLNALACQQACTQVLAPRFGRLITWSLAGAGINDFLQAGFSGLIHKANELERRASD